MSGNLFFLAFSLYVCGEASSASFQQTGLMPRQLLVASLSLFILNSKIDDYQGELCNLKVKSLVKHFYVSFPLWLCHVHNSSVFTGPLVFIGYFHQLKK